MRYSIRRQMTIVFIGLLAFILGAIFIVNAVFLERYYISNKTDDLVETYQFLNDTIGGQELDEDTSEYSTVLREMGAMTERMNLDILIIDRNGNPFPCPAGVPDGVYRFYGPGGEFLLLGRCAGGTATTIKSCFEV